MAQITQGERLSEYLQQQGVSLQNIMAFTHGGVVLKIGDALEMAYVRTINVSADIAKRFRHDIAHIQPSKKQTWQIDIACMTESEHLYKKLLNALEQMRQHDASSQVQAYSIPYYQLLNSLVSHSYSLRLSGNKACLSLV